jgi:hypothetical protein
MSGHTDPLKRQLNSRAVSYYAKDRLPRSINYDNFVNGFAARMAFYGFLVGASFTAVAFLFSYLIYGTSYPWNVVVIAASLSGLGIGAVAGLLSLPGGRRQFSEMMQEREEMEFEPAAEPAQRQSQIALQNGSPVIKIRDGKEVNTDDGHNFTFTGKNLDCLLRWYEGGAETIRKEQSAAGPGFNRLPDPITGSKYTTAAYVLKRGEFIDDNNRWTERGVAWLNEL